MTAALIGVLSFDGAVWIAPILFPALVVGTSACGDVHSHGPWQCSWCSWRILSVPTILLTRRFLDATGGLTTDDLGNLIRPLDKLQVFGVWPVGDFRFRPHNIHLTYVLIAVVAVAAVGGLVWAWRCREWGLLLYVAGAAVGCAVSVALGSPWIDGKALAIASPAALIAAAAATGWLFTRGRRVEAVVAILVVAGGVIWSNALAYREVWLAPRSQLQRARDDRHEVPRPGAGADDGVLAVRRAPFPAEPRSGRGQRATAPPRSAARRLGGPEGRVRRHRPVRAERSCSSTGRSCSCDLPRRAARRPTTSSSGAAATTTCGSDRCRRRTHILEHVPLGTYPQPAAVPPCSEVLRLGRVAAQSHGRLAAVERPGVIVVNLAAATIPPHLAGGPGGPGRGLPVSLGHGKAAVTVQADGRYGFWLAGSFRRKLELSVDNRGLGSAQNRLMHPGVDTPFGQAGAQHRAPRHRPALQRGEPQPGQRRAAVSARPAHREPVTANRPGHVRPAGECALALRQEPRLDRSRQRVAGSRSLATSTASRRRNADGSARDAAMCRT